jgi:O-antigen/teichoic acid export membrane protein
MTASDRSALDRGRDRDRNALSTTIAAGFAKAGSSLVALISLPLVVRYLGKEQYGIWVTVATMAGWLNLFDLGLGIGLKTEIAAATGRGDDDAIHGLVSAASVLSLVVVVPAVAMVWSLGSVINWPSVLNASNRIQATELRLLAQTTLTIVLVAVWTNLGYAIVHALQRGRWANYFQAGASVVCLIATVAAARLQASLPWLAVALMGPTAAGPALLWLYAAIRDRRLRPKLGTSKAFAKRLMGTGLSFFALQLAVLVVFQMDVVIIARTNGPENVTPFSVATRAMSFGTLIVGTYLNALWPAYGEAAARGDWEWIRLKHRRMRIIMTGWTAAVGVAFVLLGPWAIPLWAGDAARADRMLYIWVAASFVVRAWTDTHAMLLNGVNRVGPQIRSALVHAALTFGLSIAFAARWGPSGVAAAGFLGYALVSAWWLPLAANSVLRGEKAGSG